MPVPVASVDVTPDPATVLVGQTVQLTATPRDAAGNALSRRVVSWSSSNTGAATGDNAARVRGAAAVGLSVLARAA